MPMTGNAEAARRVVEINHKLAKPLTAEARNALMSEQKTIWDGLFPGRSFEEIADTVH